MKKYSKIFVGLGIIIVLAVVFWWGGNSSSLHGWSVEETNKTSQVTENVKFEKDGLQNTVNPQETTNDQSPVQTEDVKEEKQNEKGQMPEKPPTATAQNSSAESEQQQIKSEIIKKADENIASSGDIEYSKEKGMDIDEETGKDKYSTDPVPEGKPVPVDKNNTTITDKELTCTLSVRCDTVLDNLAYLDSEKVEIIPEDGIIFNEKTVTFYEGETVFNLLQREMKKNKIHMEFVNTPIYNSSYIEGIANLYEFDCGELSGWLYKVNGWFPNYGCSRYALKQGDKVEFVFTCDFGEDVGADASIAGGQKDE